MNKYEQSFVKWFSRDGWMIRGKEVWHKDIDSKCPFKLTYPMIERLVKEGVLLRIYPSSAPDWLECYDLESRYKNLCWDDFEKQVFGAKESADETSASAG